MNPFGEISRNVRMALVVLALCATAPACTSYIDDSPFIRSSLAEQDFDAALNRIDKINKRTSRLLYLYERGLVLHYQNRYEESIAAFEEAELVYEELYTKSLTLEIGSLVTSDNIIKYRGERYEAAMIHYYKILDFLYLGQPEGALIECRKLNHRLQVFRDDQDNTVYPNDPFLQYLTGMVYGAFGERVDADVSLRVALEAYDGSEATHGVTMPSQLYCDLIRSAYVLSDREAIERYQMEGICDEDEPVPEGSGVLTMFLECGYIAAKAEENIVMPIYKDEYNDDLDPDKYAHVLYDRRGHARNPDRKLEYLLRAAVPVMVETPFPFDDAEVRATVDGRTYRAYALIVENLDALALNAFEARKGQIVFKTIVRGLTKYLAKKTADKKEGKIAGWLVNALNVATESADSRSWSTLPRTIRMSRLVLPEGVHDVEVVLLDVFGGRDESITIEDVEIKAGRTTFMNYRFY
jgi:tetratricopeptide (TPR) repeat protein